MPLRSAGCERTCHLAEGEMRLLMVRRGNTSRDSSSVIPTVPSAGPCHILEECCLQEGLGGNMSDARLSTGAVQYCQGTEIQEVAPQPPSWVRLGKGLWRGPKCFH